MNGTSDTMRTSARDLLLGTAVSLLALGGISTCTTSADPEGTPVARERTGAPTSTPRASAWWYAPGMAPARFDPGEGLRLPIRAERASAAPFWLDTDRGDLAEAGLRLRIDGRRVLFPIESVFVLPGDTVSVDAVAESGAVRVRADDGVLSLEGPGVWEWRAPVEPGRSALTVEHPTSGARVTVQAFVLVPRDEVDGGRLNGYRIGRYPAVPPRFSDLYAPPEGFVEVTSDNADVPVSPHFRLSDFPSRQSTRYPKYLVLRPELLTRLELVLRALQDRGYPATSFHVLSGFRTPFYNVSVLGNVPFSRHQWGGAADVFVDERPRNGRMDDLDGDGRVGTGDARVIEALVDSLEAAHPDVFPVGGLGVYSAHRHFSPFLHLDARGRAARWSS